MTQQTLAARDRAIAEGLSLLYIASIAAVADTTGLSYLLFPELAALSYDVLARPWGKWASQPWRLILTPTLSAIIGTLITRHLPYHVLTILLIVCLSVGVIALLKSNIAPAISAGVLPLVLDTKSWLYPVSIFSGLVVLAVISLLWRRRYLSKQQCLEPLPNADIDDVLESKPNGKGWIVPWLIFVTIAGICAQASGLRFILFPPLIVIAYEMFAHPAVCPWNRKPISLPIACFFTATGGLVAAILFGSGSAAAAGLSMIFGLVVLRLMDIHLPPALAVGLIPLIIASPSTKYPLSVGIGTVALTLSFLLYQRVAISPRITDKFTPVLDRIAK